MDCARPDITEVLALGLWPEEFPSESKKIREHLQACTECRNELLMMERVAGMLRKYRAELAPVLSECPSAEDITSLAAGDIVDPSVLSHLEGCEHCRDEVQLAREALQLEVSSTEETPSAAHMAQVRRAVAREYDRTRESRCQSIVVKVRDFFAGFRIPSLVAAALVGSLVLLVVPHGPKEKPFRVVRSDAVWDTAPRMVNKSGGPSESFAETTESPTTLSKGWMPLQSGAVHREKVALVILVSTAGPLSSKELADIYRGINIPGRLAESYEFISPAELAGILVRFKGKGASRSDLARQIFRKTGAEYFLAFQVERDGATTAVRGQCR